MLGEHPEEFLPENIIMNQDAEIAKLREENQRIAKQAKIDVLREVLDEDVNWNPPLEIIVERKLKQLEGE